MGHFFQSWHVDMSLGFIASYIKNIILQVCRHFIWTLCQKQEFEQKSLVFFFYYCRLHELRSVHAVWCNKTVDKAEEEIDVIKSYSADWQLMHFAMQVVLLRACAFALAETTCSQWYTHTHTHTSDLLNISAVWQSWGLRTLLSSCSWRMREKYLFRFFFLLANLNGINCINNPGTAFILWI